MSKIYKTYLGKTAGGYLNDAAIIKDDDGYFKIITYYKERLLYISHYIIRDRKFKLNYDEDNKKYFLSIPHSGICTITDKNIDIYLFLSSRANDRLLYLVSICDRKNTRSIK